MIRILIPSALLWTGILFGQTDLKLAENGKPLTGTVVTEKSSTTYKNGYIMEKIIKDEFTDKPLIIEKYDNDLPVSVEYFNFTIKSKPQKSYKGFYKEGKKYDGFFLGEEILGEFYLVDYYFKGERQLQYSFDYLEQTENYSHYIYDKETDFKQEKISNGYLYNQISSGNLLVTAYKNGTPTRFFIDVFAMHYFNRISVELNGSDLMIREHQSKQSIKVSSKNGKLQVENFGLEGQLISVVNLNDNNDFANLVGYYYIQNNELKYFSINKMAFESDLDSLVSIFGNIIYSFKGSNTTSLLQFILDKFESKSKSMDLSSNLFTGFPFEEEEAIMRVIYDDKGKAFEGSIITGEKNAYKIKIFKKGEIIKEEEAKSIDDLRIKSKQIFEELYN